MPLRRLFSLSLLFAFLQTVSAADPEVFTKQPDPPTDLAKEKTLYAVGYAHLDTQWRWAYPQVIRDFVRNTLQDNFRLLDKYPNYVFNFSGSRRYEMMKEYYPADYEKLKGYIAAGRWFPCGSSVDEADANVPGLEAFIRQILYGNHYFRQEFGKASDEFMLPDCFGFPASLPSILAHCGVKGFSTQKLTWGSANGVPFKVGVWIGPDGKKIIAALDPGAYTGKVKEDLSHSESWLKRIERTGELSGAYADYHYFGTGDQGGAPSEESVQWIERSLVGKGPVRVVSSDAERMFKDLKPEQTAKLPTYQGELLLTEHSAGSITSQAYMKRWNRKNELLADAAERASVVAMSLGGAPYPAKKLYDAWDLVLGSQMHDMLPGTSLPKAYEYCWNDEILAANLFAAVETDAVGTVASAMDTAAAQGIPLVVYNPLARERTDVVEAAVTFPGEAPPGAQVFTMDGQAVPTQFLRREGSKAHLLFLATVPSVGFAAFDVRPAGATANASNLKVTPTSLENDRYRVALNEGGDVASIFDKAVNKELLAAPARLGFHYEKPLRYPAWNMDWADRQKPARGYVDGPARMRIVENGPVRVAVEVEREAQGSRFVQQIRLAAGAAGDRVEFANVIDWQSRECSLKASFPLTCANPLASYDDKLGVPVRGNNDAKKYEVPQHQWFDLTSTNGDYGVAVLNDSKFGSDKPDDRTMRLTLLYTPGVRNDYQDQALQDIGHHEILYAVAGHAGDWRAGGVPAQAERLNQPLAPFQATRHGGKLGSRFSALKVDSDQISVVAVKKAEDGDEIVVRIKETTGKPTGKIRLESAAPIIAAREMNGQEQEIGPATLANGGLTANLEAFGLRTFAVKFSDSSVQLVPPRSQPMSLAYDADVVSTQSNLSDGTFDKSGRSYPAEQLPAKLSSEGIEFQLGSTTEGQKNAMTCRGQKLDLPAGDFNRVYLLAAASDGDAKAVFKVGDRVVEQPVQDWGGFIGLWDNRLWKGKVPELLFAWNIEWDGLVPGFTKRDTVAWYASHRHHPKNGDEYYQYCYLFKYGFDLPTGARSITLPDNPQIRVFAVSVARNDHEGCIAAHPLFDTLEENARQLTAPRVSPAGGQFKDATLVALEHPLYWKSGGMRYTLDGSEPTANSPVYNSPLLLQASTTIRARMFWPNQTDGPEAKVAFDIDDVTPPTIKSVSSLSTVPNMLVIFSEPVDKNAAENAGNYRLEPAMEIVSARLAEDSRSVTLVLVNPLPANSSYRLAINGISDCSPHKNALPSSPTAVSLIPPAYTLDSIVCDGTTSREEKVIGLPVGHAAPWTINMFVRTDRQPENRTIIAGFGAPRDDTGRGRYLSKFANGIHFWSADRDVETTTPLAVGEWQMLTATYDGHKITVYKDAEKIGEEAQLLSDDEPLIEFAPIDPWDKRRRFAGEIRRFSVWNSALSKDVLKQLREFRP